MAYAARFDPALLTCAQAADVVGHCAQIEGAVAAVKALVSVNLIPVAHPETGCAAASFAVRVSAKTGASPTGTVALMSGTDLLASATLDKGAAVLSARALAPGAHALVARYGGDSTYRTAVSPVMVITSPSTGGSCGSGLPVAGTAR